MKAFLGGVIDRGNGSGQNNQKTGPPGAPTGYAAYNNTDIAGGVIYVAWSDLEPLTLGTLGACQGQALAGSGAGWTAKGTNLIDFALTQAAGGLRQDGSAGAGTWQVVVRVGAGIYSAPYLFNNFGIPQFTYADTSGSPNGVCPAWWHPNYVSSYASLMSKLAALYDSPAGHGGNDALLVSFTVVGAMNGVYQEPLLRGMGTESNIEGELFAGYVPGSGDFNTVGSDQWAQQQALLAHQVFVNTYSDIALNPYQYINIGTSPTMGSSLYTSPVTWPGSAPTFPNPTQNYSAGTTYNKGDAVVYKTSSSPNTWKTFVCKVNGTIGVLPTNTANWWGVKPQTGEDGKLFATTLMDEARRILGGKCLIGNNSLRTGSGYQFLNNGGNYNDLYYNMKIRSTSAIFGLGNAAAPQAGLVGGGSGLKIQTSTGARLGGTTTSLTDVLDTCVANGINWVEAPGGYDSPQNDNSPGPYWFLPPGVSGAGTHAAHGAAYYTTALQANAAPNTGGGGGGGGGGNPPPPPVTVSAFGSWYWKR